MSKPLFPVLDEQSRAVIVEYAKEKKIRDVAVDKLSDSYRQKQLEFNCRQEAEVVFPEPLIVCDTVTSDRRCGQNRFIDYMPSVRQPVIVFPAPSNNGGMIELRHDNSQRHELRPRTFDDEGVAFHGLNYQPPEPVPLPFECPQESSFGTSTQGAHCETDNAGSYREMNFSP